MVYRIYNVEDINKIEQFLEQEHIVEYEKEHYAIDIVLKDDIESTIDCFDEYENIDKEILGKASRYAKDKMWNDYEWCEYNEALKDYIDEGIKLYSNNNK